MSQDWQKLIRFGLYLALIVGALALVSRGFGGELIRDIRDAMPREFRSRMGVISLFGFLAIVYFAADESAFNGLTSLLVPASAHESVVDSDTHHHLERMVGALIIAFFGNLIFIARMSHGGRRR